MSWSRRELLALLPVLTASAAGIRPGLVRATGRDPYAIGGYGNARVLHLTDVHAQLEPVHFREPSVNIGVGASRGRVPHLVGRHWLAHFGIAAGSRAAHAFTFLDFTAAANRFGPLGGLAHLKTLIDRLRGEAGPGRSLLLDGGDLWQGSATAYWTGGRDMVAAGNRLGIDMMTGHWEFTHPEAWIRANIAAFHGEFLAQNVFLTPEARFAGAPAFDPSSGRVFRPYSVRRLGQRRVAVIGQAFPFTPIAHPARFIPDWTFGIHEARLQALVDEIRRRERPDAVLLLSHNGMDVDLKLAGRVSGIDVILGGHTHDAVPLPSIVRNPGGCTAVTGAGTNGKFLAVLDLDLAPGKLRGFRYHLLPVFAAAIRPDPAMTRFIAELRAPYGARLSERLALTENLLYRRGNFNGTLDQLICDALRAVLDAEIALSPGFRWGTTLLPGQAVMFEDLMAATAISYPQTYVRSLTGRALKALLEDVCDNLFNPDPYYQQGGDMVRTGGLRYRCDPGAPMGRRISGLTLACGKPVVADKSYQVAGWASVHDRLQGRPVWAVVADYLRARRSVRIAAPEQPRLLHERHDPGIAGAG